jgi:hypothetical protein
MASIHNDDNFLIGLILVDEVRVIGRTNSVNVNFNSHFSKGRSERWLLGRRILNYVAVACRDLLCRRKRILKRELVQKLRCCELRF